MIKVNIQIGDESYGVQDKNAFGLDDLLKCVFKVLVMHGLWVNGKTERLKVVNVLPRIDSDILAVEEGM